MAAYTTADSLGIAQELEAQWQSRINKKSACGSVGEWQEVASTSKEETTRPDERTSPAPALATNMSVLSDRDRARTFALSERTLSDEDDDVPVVVKRRRDAHDVKSEPEVLVKREAEDETTPASTKDTPADDLPLFKRRKARSGTLQSVRASLD